MEAGTVIILLIVWLLLSAVVSDMGDSRKIGKNPAFWLSILISPVVGFIVVLLSDKVEEATEDENIDVDKYELLERIGKLKQDGILSQEEFDKEKAKIMSMS